jgi:PKD repeat protein
VTNADACNGTGNSNTIFVTVNPMPVTDFSIIQTINSLTIQFLNNSSNATTYAWDFGDGNTSTAANPSHTYGVGGNYTVTLTASNGNCSTTHSLDILNVSTEEMESTALTVYPNPAENELNITIDQNAIVHIINLAGQQVASERIVKGNNTIDIQTIASGLYFAQIQTNNGIQVVKFQKK